MKKESPYSFETLFHGHLEGTDEHSTAKPEEIKEAVESVLGVPGLFLGAHFREPANPEVTPEIPFDELFNLAEKEGLRPGFEFNICKTERGWELDINPEELRKMKKERPPFVVIASIHATKALGFSKERDRDSSPEQGASEMLWAYTEIIDKYDGLIDIIGHPFQYVDYSQQPLLGELHLRTLVLLAKEHDIALEVNAAQIGFKKLMVDEDFRPSRQQIQDWSPLLRFPGVLQEEKPLLVVGLDIHGNTKIEEMLKSGEHLPHQALRLAAAFRRYCRYYEIPGERIINTWDESKVEEWLKRNVPETHFKIPNFSSE